MIESVTSTRAIPSSPPHPRTSDVRAWTASLTDTTGAGLSDLHLTSQTRQEERACLQPTLGRFSPGEPRQRSGERTTGTNENRDHSGCFDKLWIPKGDLESPEEVQLPSLSAK